MCYFYHLSLVESHTTESFMNIKQQFGGVRGNERLFVYRVACDLEILNYLKMFKLDMFWVFFRYGTFQTCAHKALFTLCLSV